MKYLEEHEKFLKKYEQMPRQELTNKFNNKFKTETSVRALSQKCRKMGLVCLNDGCFKKGSIPTNKGTKGFMKANKTSFRTGSVPLTAKRIGSISTRKDKNNNTYMHIKVSNEKVWKALHVYIWEHKHGKVPKGHCVIFKDKNTLNTRLDNLMLISRSELVRLNQKYAHIDKSLKETALQIIKITNEIKKD